MPQTDCYGYYHAGKGVSTLVSIDLNGKQACRNKRRRKWQEKKGLFKRLVEWLTKQETTLAGLILFSLRLFNNSDDFYEELEEIVMGDIGINATPSHSG